MLDSREPKDIEHVITEAISDPGRLKTMGEKSTLNIQKEFSWERMEASGEVFMREYWIEVLTK